MDFRAIGKRPVRRGAAGQKRVSEWERKEIVAAIGRGELSFKKMAKAVKVHPATLRNWVKQFGKPQPLIGSDRIGYGSLAQEALASKRLDGETQSVEPLKSELPVWSVGVMSTTPLVLTGNGDAFKAFQREAIKHYLKSMGVEV